MPRPNATPAPAWSPARLRALVAESGLSTRQVAERGGPDQSDLSKILAGKVEPRASTVAAILSAIGRGWADLDG